MDLKDFIKTAVSDITNAISDLQNELENSAIVNPTLPNPISLKTICVDNQIRPIEQLNFDVAVTVTESSGIDGSVKVGISIFGAKLGTETTAKNENVSRITFSIPVVYPCHHVKSPKEFMDDKTQQHREWMREIRSSGLSGQNGTNDPNTSPSTHIR